MRNFFNPSIMKSVILRRKIAELNPACRVYFSASILNPRADPALIRVGSCSMIRGELFVFAHGGRIEIGSECYIGHGSRIWSGAEILIGDHVLVSHNVSIMDNLTHPIDAMARRRQIHSIYHSGHPTDIELDDRPVKLSSDCWIGAQSVILRGVTVGEGAIVAAGSVVTKDVPAWTIVGGNPARVLRELERPSP